MRIDHLAFRVADRNSVASFLEEAFGYHKQAEFPIDFSDGTKAQCIALEPVEKTKPVPWKVLVPWVDPATGSDGFVVPQVNRNTTCPLKSS